MNVLWRILAISGLVLTLLPSLLVFSGMVTLEESHRVMAAGSLLWFVSRYVIGMESQGREKN